MQNRIATGLTSDIRQICAISLVLRSWRSCARPIWNPLFASNLYKLHTTWTSLPTLYKFTVSCRSKSVYKLSYGEPHQCLNLTTTFVNTKIKPPAQGQIIIRDDALPGFGLRVTPQRPCPTSARVELPEKFRRVTIGRHGKPGRPELRASRHG